MCVWHGRKQPHLSNGVVSERYPRSIIKQARDKRDRGDTYLCLTRESTKNRTRVYPCDIQPRSTFNAINLVFFWFLCLCMLPALFALFALFAVVGCNGWLAGWLVGGCCCCNVLVCCYCWVSSFVSVEQFSCNCEPKRRKPTKLAFAQ